MTISPEIQRNAQAEIDAVVGTERLPALSDRENLPYIEALIKELLRYQPPLPYGASLLGLASPSFVHALCQVCHIVLLWTIFMMVISSQRERHCWLISGL